MTLADKIESLLFANPDEEYALEDIALKFESTPDHVRRTLRNLATSGRLKVEARVMTVVKLTPEWQLVANGL